MKHVKPSEHWYNTVKFLIDYTQHNRGTVKELTERLEKRTGEKIYRQYCEGWLNPDADKRIEPKSGLGLLLIEEGKKMIAEKNRVWPKKTPCPVGSRFGKLIVLGVAASRGDRTRWRCLCDCGSDTEVVIRNILSGNTKSCGCSRGASTRPIHGETVNGAPSPEYRTWVSMKNRCNNPKSKDYSDYGGRGIKVYAAWNTSFVDFLFHVGRRPEGMTIHRKDNSKGYEPGNVEWATPTKQANNRRSSKTLTFKGETKTFAEWEVALGLPKGIVKQRAARGWETERILTP